MKKMFTALLILIIMAAATGCVKNAKRAKKVSPDQPRQAAHSISKKEKDRLMKDARANLRVIMKTTDSTSSLKKALTGLALRDMADRIAGDLAAGRAKVRRYDNMKLALENYTKGIAGIALTFTDNSYIIETGTKRILEKPGGKEVKLLLALKKIKGRWLIIEIFSSEIKEQS